MRQECVLGEDQEKRSSRSSQRDLPIGSSHAQARTLKNKHNFYQMEVRTRLSEKKKTKSLAPQFFGAATDLGVISTPRCCIA